MKFFCLYFSFSSYSSLLPCLQRVEAYHYHLRLTIFISVRDVFVSSVELLRSSSNWLKYTSLENIGKLISLLKLHVMAKCSHISTYTHTNTLIVQKMNSSRKLKWKTDQTSNRIIVIYAIKFCFMMKGICIYMCGGFCVY